MQDQEISAVVEVIRGYRDTLEARGIQFVFMPVPNKENVYYDLLLVPQKPQFLPSLIAQLRAEGIEVGDL